MKMKRLHHFIAALKNFLVVSTGAILALKVVEQTFDFQFIIYVFIGIGGYTVLSMFEEELKNDKNSLKRKRNKF